jgi:hypothetical protein
VLSARYAVMFDNEKQLDNSNQQLCQQVEL